jgi:hypothetical protein
MRMRLAASLYRLRMTLSALPRWTRPIVFLAALPGLLAVALSIVAFLVSLLALLVCAVPVVRLLEWMTGTVAVAEEQGLDEPSDGLEMPEGEEAEEDQSQAPAATIEPRADEMPGERPARRAIDVRIVEEKQ